MFASRLDGTIGEILTLWNFRSPMGQRRSPAMRLTEPPMMTTPNRYDSKACDSTARSSWSGTRRPATATTLSSKQMAADNHTTIVSNLVDDPELRFTNTGIAAGHRPLA